MDDESHGQDWQLEIHKALEISVRLKKFVLILFVFLTACAEASAVSPTPTSTNTHTLTITSIPDVNEFVDGKAIIMLLIPAGEFTMGSNDDSDNRNQAHTVYLDAFYMDKYEVANAHYAACVTAGVCEPPEETKSFLRPSYYGDLEFDH